MLVQGRFRLQIIGVMVGVWYVQLCSRGRLRLLQSRLGVIIRVEASVGMTWPRGSKKGMLELHGPSWGHWESSINRPPSPDMPFFRSWQALQSISWVLGPYRG